MKDFYRTPEFCGVCHKAAVPKLLNDYKWLRAFNVYDEWQQSSWSRQSPLPFYKKDAVSTCQTCHMAKVTAATDYGAKAGQIASHRFLGASTTIPIVYNYPEQLKKVTEYLKDGILGMDLFGIAVNGEIAEPNCVYLAPGGKQMKIGPAPNARIAIRVTDDPPENACPDCPVDRAMMVPGARAASDGGAARPPVSPRSRCGHAGSCGC